MFAVLLLALTVSGKREVKQLSVYELVLLIGLGSAAGDPMFYHDVPLTAAVVVFVVMMGCYKLITYLSDKNKTLRDTIEGKPVYIVQDGRILSDNFDKEDLGHDELFSELRQVGIEQLGQVRLVILEPSGQLSIFQYDDTDVKPGLPIMPHLLSQQIPAPKTPGNYACTNCGHVQVADGIKRPVCGRCGKQSWIKAEPS